MEISKERLEVLTGKKLSADETAVLKSVAEACPSEALLKDSLDKLQVMFREVLQNR